MSLEDRVSGIIVEQLGVTKDELAPEANFIDENDKRNPNHDSREL